MFVSFTPAIAGLPTGQLAGGGLVRLPGVAGAARIGGRRAGFFNPRALGQRVQIPANPRIQIAPPQPPIDPVTGGIDLVTQGNDLVIQGAATNDIAMVAAGAEMRDRGENVNKAIVKKRKSIKQVIEDQLS